MKKLFILVGLLFTTNLFAQKIEINDAEEVMIDGKQIGRLEKVGEDIDAVYTFYNLNDDELFSVHTSDDNAKVFVMTFALEDYEAHFPSTKNNTRSYIIKEVLKNKLIVNGELNTQRVKNYCAAHKAEVKKIDPNKDDAQSDEDLLNEVISKAKEKKEKNKTEKEENIDSKEVEEEDAVATQELDPLDAVIAAAREQQKEKEQKEKERKEKEEAERKKIEAAKEIKAVHTDSSDALVHLELVGEKIYVDQKHVGFYKVFNITLEGQKSKNISLYNVEGKRIGVIKYKIGDNLAIMTTAKDGKQTDLGFSLTDQEEIKKDLITQAAELGYFK